MNSIKVNNNNFFEFLEEEIKTKDITFKVKGKSMTPFLKDGKTAVTLTKSSDFKKYDIILFKINDKYILHRIIKIKENKIICQGDNLFSLEFLKTNDIIGKVISYQTKKEVLTNSFFYKLRVRVFYFFKGFKRIIRRALNK